MKYSFWKIATKSTLWKFHCIKVKWVFPTVYMSKSHYVKALGEFSPTTFTSPLTAGFVGAPQMTSQPVSSIFLCSPLPSGTWRTPGLSIPKSSFSHLFLSALSSSPFHRALRDGFGQTWWTGDMSIPLQLASLYDGQEVFAWSDCLLDL